MPYEVSNRPAAKGADSIVSRTRPLVGDDLANVLGHRGRLEGSCFGARTRIVCECGWTSKRRGLWSSARLNYSAFGAHLAHQLTR